MDDFGTGYSSLSYLRRFPFNRIKIDQSFVRELGTRDDCIAIVRAVVTLARDLGMAVTAEGVETQQQVEMLERAGCAEVQGYLFSQPVPGPAVTGLVRSMPAIAVVWPPCVVPVLSEPTTPRKRLPALSG
jgi:EAL domain-containing protein (putative c-di-GMP-specific phosphodiesterase class I)